MHQQVGVAAYGRREMTVGGRGKAEMPDVDGLVHGPRLRPQDLLGESGPAPAGRGVGVDVLSDLAGDSTHVVGGGRHRIEHRGG